MQQDPSQSQSVQSGQQEQQQLQQPVPKQPVQPQQMGIQMQQDDMGFRAQPDRRQYEKLEFINLPYNMTKNKLTELVSNYHGFIRAYFAGARGYASFYTREDVEACVESFGMKMIYDHEVFLRPLFVADYMGYYPQDGMYPQPQMQQPGYPGPRGTRGRYYDDGYESRYRQPGDYNRGGYPQRGANPQFNNVGNNYNEPGSYRGYGSNSRYEHGWNNDGNVGNKGGPNNMGFDQRQNYQRYPSQQWGEGPSPSSRPVQGEPGKVGGYMRSGPQPTGPNEGEQGLGEVQKSNVNPSGMNEGGSAQVGAGGNDNFKDGW